MITNPHIDTEVYDQSTFSPYVRNYRNYEEKFPDLRSGIFVSLEDFFVSTVGLESPN